MQITPTGYQPLPLDLARKTPTASKTNGFGDALHNALQEISQEQSNADNQAVQLALGKNVDVHDAVLSMDEAQLSFQYALQIRNKLIDAYQEVMRMQV